MLKSFWLYRLLNNIGLSRSYVAKIMAVSFVGVHVPLIILVIYLLVGSPLSLADVLPIAATVLVATLLGTAMTLSALWLLLNPVRAASAAIRDYLGNRRVATLPTTYPDEVGRLLADVQEGITRLDGALDASRTERNQLSEERQAYFDMLSKMSHELRTPLNAILGFAEVMQSEMMGPLGSQAYTGYAEFIHKSGADMLHMVDGLLHLSEAKAPQADRLLNEVNMGDLLTEVSHLQHLHAERNRVQIGVRVTGTPPVLRQDPRAIKQVLLFTLSGLVAGTAAGQTVTAHIAPSPNGEVDIRFAAAGVFAPQDLPRPLRPAVMQGAGSIATGSEFTSVQGFSLAVAQAIAQAEGVSMSIDAGRDSRSIMFRFADLSVFQPVG